MYKVKVRFKVRVTVVFGVSVRFPLSVLNTVERDRWKSLPLPQYIFFFYQWLY